MDPIAALSLAVNIVQVVVWGREATSFCLDVYKSGEINPEQKVIVDNIQKATESIQSSLASQSRVSGEDRYFLEVAQKCQNAAAKLLDKVGPVNLSRRKRAIFKALFERRSVKALEEDFVFCQKALQTRILFDLRRKHDLTALRHDEAFDHIGKDVQNLVFKLEAGEMQLTKIIATQDIIVEKLDALNLKIGSPISNNDSQTILRSLFFPEMSTRQEIISGTYPRTYGWVFRSIKSHKESMDEGDTEYREIEDNSEDDYSEGSECSVGSSRDSYSMAPSWPDMRTWLENGQGIYWISGKAGSGKSTFMKYIFENTGTKEAIAAWSGLAKYSTSGYFFWSQGIALQKSTEGLLRTALFQTIHDIPGLASFCGFDPAVGIFKWTKARLERALCDILSQTKISLKLCLFIDGLDECMEDPVELVALLRRISSFGNLKCVVSSRPFWVFRTEFNGDPQMFLHELTARDIDTYVSGNLERTKSPVPLTMEQRWELIRTLRNKAEGIFLWVTLATGSILEGLRNGDSFEELTLRVDELPLGLDELYKDILSRIEERYRIMAIRYFQILLLDYTREDLVPSVLILSLVDLGIAHDAQDFQPDFLYDTETVIHRCNLTLLHLQRRCGGLLHFEFGWSRGASEIPEVLRSIEDSEELRVQFLHRTILDFFRQSHVVMGSIPKDLVHPWDPMVARAEAFIRRISIVEPNASTPLDAHCMDEFSINVKHIGTALLVIRELEMHSGVSQAQLLAHLDAEGEKIFQFIGQQCFFEPEVHWCTLFSPHFDKNIGSGSLTSLLDLCAICGFEHTIKARIPNLDSETRTHLLHCTLNGLVNFTEGYFVRGGYPGHTFHLPSVDSGEFSSHTSCIIALLEAGANPNVPMKGFIRMTENKTADSNIRSIKEELMTGYTAWTHFLRMLTLDFYSTGLPLGHWHNTEKLSTWAELMEKFIESGADPQQLLQNLTFTVGFGISEWWGPRDHSLAIRFTYAASALSIIDSYFRGNEQGRAFIHELQSAGFQEVLKFSRLELIAEENTREIFDVLFDLSDPSFLEVGCLWDISGAVIDDLGPRIFDLYSPIWQSFPDADSPRWPWGIALINIPQLLSDPTANRHPKLSVFKEVLLRLRDLEPLVRFTKPIPRDSRMMTKQQLEKSRGKMYYRYGPQIPIGQTLTGLDV
ncbi:hypothetical protein PVAG01_09726 [Phlyctema vagabunda]|uniref:NACHT domain-containing protein n=1 Tax=Phlyctema vagabunda TaxID=108571 RepID=A0ABR4P894_9HELO